MARKHALSDVGNLEDEWNEFSASLLSARKLTGKEIALAKVAFYTGAIVFSNHSFAACEEGVPKKIAVDHLVGMRDECVDFLAGKVLDSIKRRGDMN